MPYLTCDITGEVIWNNCPVREFDDEEFSPGFWIPDFDLTDTYDIVLPKGSIKKLIGRDLTWEDEPVKIE